MTKNPSPADVRAALLRSGVLRETTHLEITQSRPHAGPVLRIGAPTRLRWPDPEEIGGRPRRGREGGGARGRKRA